MTFSVSRINNNILKILVVIFALCGVLNIGCANADDSPSFDSFMLNDQNYAVVFGKAPASSKIELMDGARKLGEADADDQGHFSITLQKLLGVGKYQFVLRATDSSGKSLTSIQTVTVIVSGEGQEGLMAFMHDPTGARRFISDEPSILRTGNVNETEFNVSRISYRKNTLTITGEAPENTQIMMSIGRTRFGTEKTKRTGIFEFSHYMSLFPGDHIFRFDLLNNAGETIESLGVPFRTEEGKTFASQFYYDGKPVRTIIVHRGDSLSSIAQKVYGSSRYEEQLYTANHDKIKNRNHITEGQELVLPVIEGVSRQ